MTPLAYLIEQARFDTLPLRLRRGIQLLEWRLKHGTKWRWADDPS